VEADVVDIFRQRATEKKFGTRQTLAFRQTQDIWYVFIMITTSFFTQKLYYMGIGNLLRHQRIFPAHSSSNTSTRTMLRHRSTYSQNLTPVQSESTTHRVSSGTPMYRIKPAPFFNNSSRCESVHCSAHSAQSLHIRSVSVIPCMGSFVYLTTRAPAKPASRHNILIPTHKSCISSGVKSSILPSTWTSTEFLRSAVSSTHNPALSFPPENITQSARISLG
jgi:hypothetical protein